MQSSHHEPGTLTPQQSWGAIHETMEEARSSMYVAGTSTILLLWGFIVSLGFASQYATETLAPEFASTNPWFAGPLWGVLAIAGMLGSAIIGHRAGREKAVGDVARNAGIKVFLFWLSVAAAALLVPAAAGMWNEDSGANIPHVAIGIVALGYILFGIMSRPVIAAVGVGIAAAFYVPGYLAGDAALAVSAVAMLAIAVLGAVWIRRSGIL
ncbi:MAG: hypothetical protein OXD46_12435 [Chloroflexi bacterium]|nr:hypothetical protein [Chloroflexota bacterium]